jgi:hypothetical protein
MPAMTARRLPPQPGVFGPFAAGVAEFVNNAWRFLVANLAFGVLLLIMSLYVGRSPVALLLAIPMILPVAGLMRMAAVELRSGGARLTDFLSPMRRPWAILGLGTVQLVVALVMWIDVVVGLGSGQLLPAILAIGALYLLLAIWSFSVLCWPLLLDPLRDGQPVRARLVLALHILLAHAMRVLAFAILSGLLLALATAAIGIVVSFGLALIWLSIANFSLPLADRFEGRLTAELPDPDDA